MLESTKCFLLQEANQPFPLVHRDQNHKANFVFVAENLEVKTIFCKRPNEKQMSARPLNSSSRKHQDKLQNEKLHCKVLFNVTHVQQKTNWDCGIACVKMICW
jgi:beta-lactamase superfamily II metal-dependent hydrolase